MRTERPPIAGHLYIRRQSLQYRAFVVVTVLVLAGCLPLPLSERATTQHAQGMTGWQSEDPPTTKGLIPLRFVTETGVTCSFVPRSHDALKLKGFLGHPITTPSY